MNLYLRTANLEHYDMTVINHIVDCGCDIYSYLTDPIKDNSVFIIDLDRCDEFTDKIIIALKEIKNKKILFMNNYKCLSYCHGKRRIRSMSDYIDKFGFAKKDVYIVTELLADVENITPYFNSSNIFVNDKWLNEFYLYQVKADMLTPKFMIDARPKPNKRFSFFNRRYEPIRFAFVAELVASGLIDSFNYTFNDHLGGFSGYKISHDDIISDIPTHLLPQREKLINWITGLPYTIPDNINNLYSKDLDELYHKSSMSIVHETHPINDLSVITEKTYKGMYFKKPFIILSQPGALELLRKSGYKTFSPLIDESYDLIEDYTQRTSVILQEINRLNSMPTDEFDELMNKCKEITEHNYKIVVSNMVKPWPEELKISNLLKIENA